MRRALPLLALLCACTDSHLFEPIPHNVPELDRSVQIKGHFCTDPADAVLRPIKIVVAMDTSLSMNISDPNNSRGYAIAGPGQLIDSFDPNDPEIYLGVMLFADDSAWLTAPPAGGDPHLVQMNSITPADRQSLITNIECFASNTTFCSGSGTNPNRSTTDFAKALNEIRSVISTDISNDAIRAQQLGKPIRSKYIVIFLSDGHPVDPDEQIDLAVQGIRDLKALTGDVTFNTVHVLDTPPDATTCDVTFDGGCPQQIIQSDIARLKRMAEEGGGVFRDFENGEDVNFLSFRVGATRRRYVLDQIVAYNLAARPGSNLEDADTDGDGLPDRLEEQIGTDPLNPDTDGDGYSDGIEYRDKLLSGAPGQAGVSPDPLIGQYPDGGGNHKCNDDSFGLDSDQDGLSDCDEALIGSAPTLVDTDSDGIPDIIEYLSGTEVGTRDTLADPDADLLLNQQEVRMHTNPLAPDVGDLANRAYRYKIDELPRTTTDGSTCYDFEVDNILLVPTLDLGGGPGLNPILLSISVKPQDDPEGEPITHIAHLAAGYPLYGIKEPPDGVLPVDMTDFVRYLR